jgi:phosphohistidine phosphatase
VRDEEVAGMRLLIVRHAIAVPRGTPGIKDADRALTPRGRRRFRSAAAGLARALPRPHVILTSPWKRARQTAVILGRAWGRLEPLDTPALAGGNLDALDRALSAYPGGAAVALVGHEPWLSELLARLLGSGAPAPLEFKKGGVAVVDVPGALAEGGRLVAYLPPRLMRRLG